MTKNLASFAWAQLNFTVGDFEGNAQKIEQVYLKHADKAAWVVLTELSLSGYYPQDLLERPDFLDRQDEALRRLQALTAQHDAWLVVGGVQRNQSGIGKPLQNGLWVLGNGLIQGTYQKRLLPTYNIFDERRHFEPGTTNLIVDRGGLRVGFVICEDLWNDGGHEYAVDPVSETVNHGVDVLVGINASPSNAGKAQHRQKLMRDLCTRHDVPLLYVNQVGSNDDIVFDGASFFYTSSGSVAFRAPTCEEADGLVELKSNGVWTCEEGIATPPSDVEIYYKHAVMGLADYLHKQGLKKVVVGSSGGIDSALTLALAVEALGAENVTAITMPSRYSSEGSVSDSVVLCQNLGVRLLTRAIESEVQEAIKNFESSFNEAPSTLTVENIQARIRGRILMEYSNHFGAIVLSTGNKSEMSVGYATLYGDMNGGLNLIGDLYKMEVYELSKYLNARYEALGRACIPQAILDKEPSAELRPGQRDQDSLPPYPVLDAMLRAYVEPTFLSKERRQADKELLQTVDQATIQAVLKLVEKAEFKRRQAPPIIRMHGKAFGRGRQVPIVHKLRPAIE
jgi:NAD+ synthase (glutamine-hydrolysing)